MAYKKMWDWMDKAEGMAEGISWKNMQKAGVNVKMTKEEVNAVKKIKKGDILNGSWGYDQTSNEYCKVLKNTGKSLMCQKIKTINHQDYDYSKGVMKVIPDPKQPEFKPFRIKIDKYDYGGQPQVSLKGKMPLDNEGGGTKVYWRKWDGSPGHDTER